MEEIRDDIKKAYPALIGSERLRARLYSDVVSDDLSHAYIIDGKRGSGRHTLALNLAASLSCERRHARSETLPCGECQSCKKILGGKSPDIIYVNRGERATLGVDSIRFIRTDVAIAPNDTDLKIYIIEDAELMTAQAQNAFLLTLEEPPSYVLFLLLCDGTEALLETIKSRAPVLRIEPVGRAELLAYLKGQSKAGELTEAELSEISVSSDGRIGEALALLDKKKRTALFKRRALIRATVAAAATPPDRAELISLTSQLGNKREELSESVKLLENALRDLLLLKRVDLASKPDSLLFYADADEATVLSERFTAARLMTLFERLSGIADMISRNANIKLTQTKLLLDLVIE